MMDMYQNLKNMMAREAQRQRVDLANRAPQFARLIVDEVKQIMQSTPQYYEARISAAPFYDYLV